MSKEIVKCDINHPISLEYSSNVKEELPDEYYPDNNVCDPATTITDIINTSYSDLNGHIRNDEINKYETLCSINIKSDLPSSEVNEPPSDNVKIEDDGICPADIEIKFCNELLLCNHCHEVYQDYCTKCRVLVHILNKRPAHTTHNRIRELPKYMLEARESIGHLGIFSVKVIPEDVRFGPFTGLNSTGLPLRIKGGRFVISNDKLENLNWMQYINPARNICEQNLFPFQYEDELYYCSTRRINVGEELLVYFGEEYEDNLVKNAEMSFVPIIKNNVGNLFACTLCCLGFSSKEYLAEHKAVSHGETKEMFSFEELAQCPFCKIYLEAREYFEHHIDYCCETNDRYRVLPSPEILELGVERCSSEGRKAKQWKRGLYKCTQCKFRTMYGADFRHHIYEHYEVKLYKCGICRRRYKAKEFLKAHVVKNHPNNKGRGFQKYTTCDYFKANIKNVKERFPHTHDSEKHCQCTKCKFKTRKKCHLKSLIKMIHLNRGKYKCTNCRFKTYSRSSLERHTKTKHLVETNYKCTECKFETNYKSNLVVHKNAEHLKASNYACKECEYKTQYKSNLNKHIKVKHLKQKDFKCTDCEYMANRRSTLQVHIEAKHLNQKNYKCTDCEYMTSRKSDLEAHIKRKHLKQQDYICTECEFKTHYRSNLDKHVKSKHLKQKDYKCVECEYVTSRKSNLQVHIKAKHVKQMDYKCTECEFKTNYKSHLKVHIKTKHLNENDYKCVECEYKTYYKSKLEAHVKTKHLKQNDFKCAECEFETNDKGHLNKHVKGKHLKQHDYKCTECEFKTSYKSSLEIHIGAKHLKQNGYKCTECEFKTNYKANLKGHIKSKHLKENN